ncbi:MAG: hypothetical protein JWL73_1766 [Actinomycetia bacterium]|nr:hypothetical protein [Actinomycetes bacterium]
MTLRSRCNFTRRGWSLFSGAVLLLVVGRIVGTIELAMLAGVALVLLALALARVWASATDVDATRVLTPRQVVVDQIAHVELELTNHGDDSTGALGLTERFDGGRHTARFVIDRIAPGARSRAVYRLPTTRRGRFDLGPLTASSADPFGLAHRTWTAAPRTWIVIRPRVHPVDPPPVGPASRGAAADPVARTRHGTSNDDFSTLREYEVGDDLRHVHWRTSARLDELMVRQDETRRPEPATVLLDVRASAHDASSFELAVEAAASIVVALARSGRPTELMTSAGAILGRAAEEHTLDRLAEVRPLPTPAGQKPARLLVPAADRRRNLDLGLLVVVTGRLDAAEAAALASGARNGSRTVLVTNAVSGAALPEASGLVLVDAASAPFAVAWARTMQTWNRANPS